MSPTSHFPVPAPLRPPEPGAAAEESQSREGPDWLGAFKTETFGGPPPRATPRSGPSTTKDPHEGDIREGGMRLDAPQVDRRIAAAGGVALLALVALIVLYAIPRFSTGSAAVAEPAVGSATIDSRPSGAEVVIDGELRGITPLSLSLPAGEHVLVVRDDTSSRSIPLVIEAGTLTAQHVEFAPSAVVAETGRLEVTSDPPGAQVVVDGTQLGTTPLILDALDVGPHQVSIFSRTGNVSRDVTIEAGTTAAVMVSLTGGANAAGWIGIQAPVELQVFEDGRLLGTTSAERMMLPAGAHDLELVNATLEFRTTVRAQIAAGGTATQTITVPNGSLSINALPWAEVYIDGTYAGTTPLGNLAIPIGSHEVVWRHPELGERRRTVAVPVQTPTRIGVDFSQ